MIRTYGELVSMLTVGRYTPVLDGYIGKRTTPTGMRINIYDANHASVAYVTPDDHYVFTALPISTSALACLRRHTPFMPAMCPIVGRWLCRLIVDGNREDVELFYGLRVTIDGSVVYDGGPLAAICQPEAGPIPLMKGTDQGEQRLLAIVTGDDDEAIITPFITDVFVADWPQPVQLPPMPRCRFPSPPPPPQILPLPPSDRIWDFISHGLPED